MLILSSEKQHRDGDKNQAIDRCHGKLDRTETVKKVRIWFREAKTIQCLQARTNRPRGSIRACRSAGLRVTYQQMKIE